MKNIIFLFSLPRSGSTLLQRILAVHPAIHTSAEPWLLLPFFYSYKESGVVSEFGHRNQALAISEFIQQLPDGESDYNHAINDFATTLYSKACKNDETYFLDKTPRYHLVVNEVIDAFPDAKVVFLWRNPLSVVSSMIQSWDAGQWRIHKYTIDLFKGLPRLLDAYAKNRSRVYALNYEQLVTSPQEVLSGLFEYLELDYPDDNLDGFKQVDLVGRMGDETGFEKYDSISPQSIERWQDSFGSTLRKKWAVQYLDFIGDEALALMGYNKNQLKRELLTASGRSTLLNDVWFSFMGVAVSWFHANLAHEKIFQNQDIERFPYS